MEKTTEMLVDEHKNILFIADTLEEECDRIQQGKNIDKAFFEKIIYFIRNYADKFHHAKEENILFKELCKDSVQKNLHCNPVDQMLYEHDLGRNFVKEMEDGCQKNDPKKVIQGGRGYVQLIREHIFKEDNILYPMGDEALNIESQRFMLQEFKKSEKSLEKNKKISLGILKDFKKD